MEQIKINDDNDNDNNNNNIDDSSNKRKLHFQIQEMFNAVFIAISVHSVYEFLINVRWKMLSLLDRTNLRRVYLQF